MKKPSKKESLKEANEIIKNGLIKIDKSNLKGFFDSKEFSSLYNEGFILLSKKGEGLPPQKPKTPQGPIKPKDLQNRDDWRKKPPRKTPFFSDEGEKRIRDGFTVKMTITSLEIKGQDGFIEFEATEFPLDTLRDLAPSCKGGFEVVWLDPERTKFTHTQFTQDGKSKYDEHSFDQLETLFSKETQSPKDKSRSKKSIDTLEME